MSQINPLVRIRDNWTLAVGRLRVAGAPRPPDWRKVTLIIAASIAATVLIGILLDARAVTWTHEIPIPLHNVFARLTRLGQSDWLLIPSGLIVVLVALGDWRCVARSSAAAWWEIASIAALLFVIIAATGLVTDIIKPIVGRTRPGYVHGNVFAFTPLSLGGYAHYSFPSGHATTMAAVAVMATFVPTIITAPVVVAASLIAVSRIVIGVHFPSDVAAGAFIGASVGYLILCWARDSRVVFAARQDGSVRLRIGVVRRLIRRERGLVCLFLALWIALTDRRQQTPSRGAPPPPRRSGRIGS
jgi:undecaprenyl-diphosphatase